MIVIKYIFRYLYTILFLIAGLCLIGIGNNLSKHFNDISYLGVFIMAGIMFFLMAGAFFLMSLEEKP